MSPAKPAEPAQTVPQVSPFGNTSVAQKGSPPNWQQHAAALWAAMNDPYPYGKGKGER
jgi:hypothetical protein